jgi:hypothetical protein
MGSMHGGIGQDHSEGSVLQQGQPFAEKNWEHGFEEQIRQ